MRNTGGKPAARFLTGTGVAPFAVSNRTRVPSLNADLLDGRHATSFVGRCGRGANALVATWYAPGLPATGYVAPNRFGGEEGFVCNGGTAELGKQATGHFRMRVVTPPLPDGVYIAFVNADARSSTALYGQGSSKFAGPIWDIHVHNAAGALADPYYLDVMFVRQ